MYVFAYLADDAYPKTLVAPANQTVTELAEQLVAWSTTPEDRGPFTVTNESGSVLDPDATLTGAGLGNGDIVNVERMV
jgi:K+-transporting ATPase c subunit